MIVKTWRVWHRAIVRPNGDWTDLGGLLALLAVIGTCGALEGWL